MSRMECDAGFRPVLVAPGTGAPGPQVTVVIGTRPEAIKLAPVVRSLQFGSRTRVVLSGQHGEMVDGLLDDLHLHADQRYEVMQPNQTLNGLAERLLGAFSSEFAAYRPDAVVVQGDTTTAMCAALAAFHESIPIAHVEAGLRSHDSANPFPEETNRRVLAQLATWHFAPTPLAASNLIKEGHARESVHVTGNTVVDSLHWIQRQGGGTSAFKGPKDRRLLVTLHRRETQGVELTRLCTAIGDVANELGLEVVLPMHRSPSVRESIIPALSANANVRLLEPLSYPDFVATLVDAALVVTDSGGVQEEAVSQGVAALITRATTERPEAIEAGARLVGTAPSDLIASIVDFMTDVNARVAVAGKVNPFGDGHAGSLIVAQLLKDLASSHVDEIDLTLLEEAEPCVSI